MWDIFDYVKFIKFLLTELFKRLKLLLQGNYMIFYKMDYTIEKALQQNQTEQQRFLQNFTDEKFDRSEAEFLFEKIADHKWYVSERLQRDIGLNVAALDYFENFHETRQKPPRRRTLSYAERKSYEDILLTM